MHQNDTLKKCNLNLFTLDIFYREVKYAIEKKIRKLFNEDKMEKALLFYQYSSIVSVKRVKKTQNKPQPDLKSRNIIILLKTMALNKYKIEFT